MGNVQQSMCICSTSHISCLNIFNHCTRKTDNINHPLNDHTSNISSDIKEGDHNFGIIPETIPVINTQPLEILDNDFRNKNISDEIKIIENAITSDEIKIIENLDLLVNNLKIIQNIKIGDKLCVTNGGELSIDNSNIPFITRTLYGNNRHITIDAVINTISKGNMIKHKYSSINLMYNSNLIRGINNLAITYQDNIDIYNKIDKLNFTFPHNL